MSLFSFAAKNGHGTRVFPVFSLLPCENVQGATCVAPFASYEMDLTNQSLDSIYGRYLMGGVDESD